MRPLRALLLAPPGAGKGTQGERIAAERSIPHLATGDILRDHVARSTELGRRAEHHMEAGELVPDDLVVELVLDRISNPELLEGFVLDGFPRTLAQAETAYRWGREHDRTFHAVVVLDVPADELVRRLVERGRDSGRADDNEATIRHRLRVYEEQSAPLLEFYERRGILVRVDGTGSVAEVTERIDAAIEPLEP